MIIPRLPVAQLVRNFPSNAYAILRRKSFLLSFSSSLGLLGMVSFLHPYRLDRLVNINGS